MEKPEKGKILKIFYADLEAIDRASFLAVTSETLVCQKKLQECSESLHSHVICCSQVAEILRAV